ncbi:hypothetical protein ASE38_01560 [Cellulomonas sp. Root930]|nr:hypothetical protein ASE38_01560 [Cellulomonas sp. Root930]
MDSMDNSRQRLAAAATSATDALQSRMLAAGDSWLVWCAAHGSNPLDSTVDEIRRAAMDLHQHGGTEAAVFDLVDQVGFMTGLWRTAEWLHLRRTIRIPTDDTTLVHHHGWGRASDEDPRTLAPVPGERPTRLPMPDEPAHPAGDPIAAQAAAPTSAPAGSAVTGEDSHADT